LLEAGAAHLGRAGAGYRVQCREAAVRGRHLATFAARRPVGVLDRPDHEVGAAAVASRAARPAVLTAVSEWAVDEVMVTFGLSAPAATGSPPTPLRHRRRPAATDAAGNDPPPF
jgi:hypothetical protein